MRWLPSCLEVLRLKGLMNTGNGVWSPWSGDHTGPAISREPTREAAVHKAESCENCGACKDSTPQTFPVFLPKGVCPSGEAQTKMKVCLRAGVGGIRKSSFCTKQVSAELKDSRKLLSQPWLRHQIPGKKSHLRFPFFQEQKLKGVLGLGGMEGSRANPAGRLMAKESPYLLPAVTKPTPQTPRKSGTQEL